MEFRFKSNIEEIIGILWLILSLMLFECGYIALGKITLFMGVFAEACAIVYAIRNSIEKRKQ